MLSLSALPRLRGPFCLPWDLQLATLVLLNQPLVIHDTQPQDPRPPKSTLPPRNLDLHPIVEPGPQPPQIEPIPKVLAIWREVRRVFQEEENKAWAAHVSEYTMQGNHFALLQAKNESIT
jgi:hypothetical protein